jgi:hypothetical protein
MILLLAALGSAETLTSFRARFLSLRSGQYNEEQGLNRRYYSLAGPNAQLWEVPDTEHCAGIHTHAAEYKQRMLDFFDANLLSE